MLDRAHARLHRTDDRSRRVGVRHHVGVGGLGLFADRAELVHRVLRPVDRIGGAGHPAAGHHLDLVRAGADLLARRSAHLAHAIGDPTEHAQAGARAQDVLPHADRAHVAVSAGLRDRLPGDQQPRPLEVPALDRLDQPVVGACGIAHGGEAALEHPFHDVLRLRRDQRGRHHRELQEVGHGRGHMHVCVDQARQQRAPAEVHHPGIVDRGGVVQHIHDPVILDDDGAVRAQAAGDAVEHGGTGEGDAGHGGAPGTAQREYARAPEGAPARRSAFGTIAAPPP